MIMIFTVAMLACSPDENTAYPPITAFQSAALKITFNFKKQSGKPQETTIHASFTNLTSNTFTDFIFQAAVPKVLPSNCCFGVTSDAHINWSEMEFLVKKLGLKNQLFIYLF
jgi:hypothetical protein